MKKLISKATRGFILAATLSLVITSCTKEQKNNLQTENASLTTAVGTSAELAPTSCGTIPSDLKPPQGNKLSLQTYASGVQIYQVRRNAVDPNIFEWVNVAPSATVYAKPDFTSPIALHYAGPSWEFSKGIFKGEKVVGSKSKAVVVDARSIPWLLLKAVDSLSSAGNKITYIQRTCTTGGLPPAIAPGESNLGKLDSIPYTANYLFYTKD